MIGVDGIRKRRGSDKEPFSMLEGWLDDLLDHGNDGIHVMVADTASDRSIRFQKYIRGKDEEGVALIFPRSDGGEDKSDILETYCEEYGVGLSTITLSDPERTACFQVDCGQNKECAAILARRVWTEFFGLTANSDYYRRIGHAPENGPADPAVLHLSRRKKTRWDVAASVLLLILLALPIATLASAGDLPDWAAIGASGSAASLVLFILYIILLAVMFKFSMKAELTEWETPFEKFMSVGLIVTGVIVPISVVLFWAGF